MQLLSDPEAAEWRSKALALELNSVSKRSADSGPPPARVRLRVQGSAPDLTGLAYMLAITGAPEYEEDAFSGALLWFKRWEVWSESIDRVGYLLLERLRSTAPAQLSLVAGPAMQFEPSEFVLAHAALLIPMLFQWDATFTLSSGAFRVDVSHEGWVDVFASAQISGDFLRKRFAEWVIR